MRKSVEPLPIQMADRSLQPPAATSNERRRRPRLQVHWPIRVLKPGTVHSIETVTRDLSSEGCYFIAKSALIPGEIRTCILGVPSHDPKREQVLPVECQVRVIRVESISEDESWGIGCRIEDYRFLPRTNGGPEAVAGSHDALQMLSQELEVAKRKTGR